MTDIAAGCITGRDFEDNRDLGRLRLLSEVCILPTLLFWSQSNLTSIQEERKQGTVMGSISPRLIVHKLTFKTFHFW